MKIKIILITIWSLLLSSQNVFAQDTAAIEKRLNELEQEVAILKRQLEINKEEAAKKAPETPTLTASTKDGFSIKSADESFKLKIRGLIQADGRYFGNTQKGTGPTDTFTIRRARLIFEGTVAKYFDFYIVPDFGNGSSTLLDAFGEFKITSWLKLKGGKFKVPMGLERLQNDSFSNFTEIGLPSNLLPNRELGFQISGDLAQESINYNLGIFNGSADLASSVGQDADNNNDKDVIGRVFVQPFKHQGPEVLQGLGVGLAGSYGHKEGSTTPTYKSAGQANVFSYASTSADGAHVRLSPQAYFYHGSFGLISEYAQSTQKVVRVSSGNTIRDSFTNTAWQVTGNYVLTGELASYKGITPNTPFDMTKGTWGAFEVVSRYGHLNIDNSIFSRGFASSSSSISEANEWGVGTNWYPNKNIRMSLDFVQTDFKGGASGNKDRKTENAVLSRFQINY